jgi:hypothetical protein
MRRAGKEREDMVKLSKTEQSYLTTLERRLKFLSERVKTAVGPPLHRDKEEVKALLWILEVVHHAAATNCQEAFAYTTLRAPADQQAVKMEESLRLSAERLAARLAKWKAARAGRTAPRTVPGVSPVPEADDSAA